MVADSPLQIEHSLKNLGFSRNEIQILIYLFQVKQSSTKDISRNTAISYSSVQFGLTSLERRNLVSLVPNGGEEKYTCCSKQELYAWIEDQRHKHETIYDEAGKDLDQFFDFVDDNAWQPSVQYYEGVEGIKDIYQDMLNEGADIYCWTDLVQVIDLLGPDFMERFIRERAKKNISMIVVRPDDVDETLKSRGMGADELRKVKLLQDLKLDGEVRIYGSKLAFITFHEERPVGFVFGGDSTAKLFKQLFESFWKLL